MVIRVLDHVEHCISYEDGDAIFQLILGPLIRGEDVVLSFDGVNAVPSSFVNASILRLTEVVPVSVIKAHLALVSSTKQINDLVKERVAFVVHGAKATSA